MKNYLQAIFGELKCFLHMRFTYTYAYIYAYMYMHGYIYIYNSFHVLHPTAVVGAFHSLYSTFTTESYTLKLCIFFCVCVFFLFPLCYIQVPRPQWEALAILCFTMLCLQQICFQIIFFLQHFLFVLFCYKNHIESRKTEF